MSKIKAIFSAKEVLLQHFVLGYQVDAYFLKYKLAIETDERGHKDRDINQEIQRQKALGRELGCEFIRINPAKENFNVFIEIGKMQNYIVKSTQKLTEESPKKSDELSNKSLRLEFKSNNSMKRKCLKYVVKHIFPYYKNEIEN